MGLISLGVGVGLGIAMAANIPTVAQPALVVVLFAYMAGVLCAFYGARRDGARAMAVAVAKATAVAEGGRAAAEAKLQALLSQSVTVNVAGPGVPALAGEGPAALGEPLTQLSQLAADASETRHSLGHGVAASDDAASSESSDHHQPKLPFIFPKLYRPAVEETDRDQTVLTDHV